MNSLQNMAGTRIKKNWAKAQFQEFFFPSAKVDGKKIYFYLCTLMVVASMNLFSQTEELGDQIEALSARTDLENIQPDLQEELTELQQHPVNLNAANGEEVSRLTFLSALQRKNLLEYVQTYGEVLSIYELQSIPGFDSLTVKRIAPFIVMEPVSVVPAPTPKNLLKLARYDFLVRYEQAFPKPAGYFPPVNSAGTQDQPMYAGDPQRYYFRCSWSWFDKLKIGLAGEKDPGEQFFSGGQKWGMDHYAANLTLSNLGILKNLIVGNFRASYGQGLTLGSGISLGSAPGFSSGLTITEGIKPSLSMNETSYLRGIAATLKIKNAGLSGFCSYHRRDANILNPDTLEGSSPIVSSFLETGYHRTAAELSDRNAIKELVAGGHFRYSCSPALNLGLKIGITALFVRWSANLQPKEQPYNRFGFRGDQQLNFGLDFEIRYRWMHLFGEISRSRNAAIAFVAGTSLSPDPRFTLMLICRNYPPGYQNLFSNAFGQNSANANEKGIYVSVQAGLFPRVTLSAFGDLFGFPWLKYRCDRPTRGTEFGLMLSWQASRNLMIHGKYEGKQLRMNSSTSGLVSKLVDTRSHSYRVQLDWVTSPVVTLRSRLEVRGTGSEEEQRKYGYLVYQEMAIKPLKLPLQVKIRYALFDIADYDQRIYVYEPDVLYACGVPAYSGRGMKLLTVFNAGLTRHLDIWLRGALTCYTDRNSMGSGLDERPGNIQGEITGQLVVHL